MRFKGDWSSEVWRSGGAYGLVSAPKQASGGDPGFYRAPKIKPAPEGAGEKSLKTRTRQELAFSTVTARRFFDQQEISFHTATRRSLPEEIVRIRRRSVPRRGRSVLTGLGRRAPPP